MKSKSAPNSARFDSELIPFSDLPGQSRLFLDFQDESVDLSRFYPNADSVLGEFAKVVLGDYQVDRDFLCDVLVEENKRYDSGKKTLANIEKLRESDCVAVLTGQQAGLFSGPSYTIYKALSAVKFSEALNERGIKAVPIFWIASEDHDFEEIRTTHIIDKRGKSVSISSSPNGDIDALPVGNILIDETIEEAKRQLSTCLSNTEFTQYWEGMIAGYRAGEDFATAFGKLIANLLSEYGLIFVSPLNENLRKLCSPIFANSVEKSDEIITGLVKRSEELAKQSYHGQVLVEEKSFLFFFIDDSGRRIALRRKDDGSVGSVDNDISFSMTELCDLAVSSPERLSPNALLRPVVQDYLFPTISYFGGAAEIAYFAQNSVIYEILSRPVTPIRHRAGFSIVEPKNRRTLEKYELEVTDLFGGLDMIRARIVESDLNPKTTRVFAEIETNIEHDFVRLEKALVKTDPTLAANLENKSRKIRWHIASLRKKYIRAEFEKDNVIKLRIEALFESLLPGGRLQERKINFLYFVNLFGPKVIEWIYSEIDFDREGHRVIKL